LQLVDVFRSVRHHWRTSLGILLLCATALGLFLFTRNEVRADDRWLASVQVLVPARDADGVRPEGVPPSLLQGQATIALSGGPTGAALEQVGLDESARGQVAFAFAANESGDILTLSVTGPERAQAIALADAYANAYIDTRREAVANGSEAGREGARSALAALAGRLVEVEAELRSIDPNLLLLLDPTPSVSDEGDGTSPAIDLPPGTPLDAVLRMYERRYLLERIVGTQQAFGASSVEAIVPQSFATIVERLLPRQVTPELPSPLLPAAVALATALLLALAVPVLIDRLDHSIRDSRTAGRAFAAPVLSSIPASANLAALARPGSARDNAYRSLAATSVATDQLPRAILVTSPVGEMQDTVAANFAAALAGLGLRVALVATDPRQGWFLDTSDFSDTSDTHGSTPTLPDLLALAHGGRLNGQVRDSLVSTGIHNLAVLAPGAASADALLDGLPPLLDALAAADVDVTVIAGPALLEEPAATILAWSTRSVLWVVEAGEVTEHEAREAASRLELAGATPFGVAMVDVKG